MRKQKFEFRYHESSPTDKILVILSYILVSLQN